jgi:hypothetical protein
LAAPLGELVAAVLRLPQDPASPRQECVPVLDQRHLAGGSLGEPSAQLALELDEAFTKPLIAQENIKPLGLYLGYNTLGKS